MTTSGLSPTSACASSGICSSDPDANINDQIATFDKAARRQVGQYDSTDKPLSAQREHAHAPNPFRSFCVCRRNRRQHRANEHSPPHFALSFVALLPPYHSPRYEECLLRCKNAKTLNRDRSNYSSKTALVAQLASEFNLEVELKNIILVAFRFFEFLHSQGQSEKSGRAQLRSALPPTPDMALHRAN